MRALRTLSGWRPASAGPVQQGDTMKPPKRFKPARLGRRTLPTLTLFILTIPTILTISFPVAVQQADPAAEVDGAGEAVEWQEHLGEFVPGDIVLSDEQGNQVDLAAFIDRPTILSLVYYSCPGICTPLLNEVADVLGKSNLDPTEQPF